MNIFLASDHRGFMLKTDIKLYLGKNHKVIDCGNVGFDPTDDHIDYVNILAHRMAHDTQSLGIVFCGSGCGVLMGVNRYSHLRGTIAHSHEQIVADCHEDLVNVLAIGAEYITTEIAMSLVDVFIQSPRGKEERYLRRTAKLGLIGTKVSLT